MGPSGRVARVQTKLKPIICSLGTALVPLLPRRTSRVHGRGFTKMIRVISSLQPRGPSLRPRGPTHILSSPIVSSHLVSSRIISSLLLSSLLFSSFFLKFFFKIEWVRSPHYFWIASSFSHKKSLISLIVTHHSIFLRPLVFLL